MRPPVLSAFRFGIFVGKLLGVAWDGLARDGAVIVSVIQGAPGL